MKKHSVYMKSVLTACGLLALTNAYAENAAPRTFCRFVPERMDDFAWENDKIAFRAYGPAAREGIEDGGVDCWLKRVEYPVINKWYQKHVDGGTYHKDSGEGYDPYHVGASLGCGGIGLWMDGELVTSEAFVGWKVIKCEPAETVFELSYAWEYGGHAYKETRIVSIRMGDRMFRTTATFWKDGAPAANHPVTIGITTHKGKAAVQKDAAAGWIACWETIDGSGLGTGVLLAPELIKEYRLDTAEEEHALFISETDALGQISWWSGYGWERAGEIKTSDAWISYLKQFKK
jgi:hypothetical protein